MNKSLEQMSQAVLVGFGIEQGEAVIESVNIYLLKNQEGADIEISIYFLYITLITIKSNYKLNYPK